MSSVRCISNFDMSDSSDDESDQPPALEDADIDDVSSGASVVSQSSDSVSIETDDEDASSDEDGKRIGAIEATPLGGDESVESEEDSDQSCDHRQNAPDNSKNSLGTPFIVPLKTGSDDEDEDGRDRLGSPPGKFRRRKSMEDREVALERNSLRRRASNDMLAAMKSAAITVKDEDDARAAAEDPVPDGRRRPPPRTKSGDGLKGGAGPARRAPPRTKSGDGLGGGEAPRRRAPARTKSGDGLVGDSRPERRTKAAASKPRGGGGGDFIVPLRGDSDDSSEDDESMTSPRGRTTEAKEEALERNKMRRQASSDMLEAMRASARKNAAPARAKSDASAFAMGRRPPPRTKSGDGLGGGDAPPRRRAPARTKSGDGMGGDAPPPRRKPPVRTKSGDGLGPAPPRRAVDT